MHLCFYKTLLNLVKIKIKVSVVLVFLNNKIPNIQVQMYIVKCYKLLPLTQLGPLILCAIY